MNTFTLLPLIICLLLTTLSLCYDATIDWELESLLQINTLAHGDGESYPKDGDVVTVNFFAAYHGKKLTASGENLYSFTLGEKYTLKCMDMVVARMSLGQKNMFLCPAELAYGSRGKGTSVPPNADLTISLELVDFSGAKRNVSESARSDSEIPEPAKVKKTESEESERVLRVEKSKRGWGLPVGLLLTVEALALLYFYRKRSVSAVTEAKSV